MPDFDAVQAAIERIAELDAERARLQTFLTTAESLRAYRARKATAAATAPATAQDPTPAAEIRKRAKAVIGALNRPVPLAELYQSLVQSGVAIGGSDPRSNLSAKLSGDPELESLPGKGWVVRKAQGPAAATARPQLNGTAG